MNADLPGVMRHEMPVSCRLKNSPLRAPERDNPLMRNGICLLRAEKSINVMRHTSVAFASGY
jgi:hypothetical protein